VESKPIKLDPVILEKVSLVFRGIRPNSKISAGTTSCVESPVKRGGQVGLLKEIFKREKSSLFYINREFDLRTLEPKPI